MSGVDSPALLDELACRGHRATDTDHRNFTVRVRGEWLWDEERMAELLDNYDGHLLIIEGTTRNQVCST